MLLCSGELFAKCPVEDYPGIAVEGVLDSSRYFVLKIVDDTGMCNSVFYINVYKFALDCCFSLNYVQHTQGSQHFLYFVVLSVCLLVYNLSYYNTSFYLKHSEPIKTQNK